MTNLLNGAHVANKLFSTIASLRLLLVMFLTLTVSANVWGATLTLNNLGSSLSATSNEEISTTTITATGDNKSSYIINYLQCKKQSSGSSHAMLLVKSTGAFISNKTAMPGNIKSVTVYVLTGAAGKTTYHCAFSTTECTSAYTTGSTAVNITGGNSNKYTCTVSNAKYFCISLGNANHGQVYKLDVEYEVAAATTYTVTLNPNYPEGKTGVFKDKSDNTINGNLVLSYPSGTASMQITSLYNSLTLDGYEFGGWYNAKGINPGDVSGSPCTNTGNITGHKTYYAKWTQKVYTVTATSNNNNYGTVSVSGTTITASPKTGYTYANPAYTVTSGTAIVTQNGNTFTVSPSTNCTVRINFEAKPKYTVNWYVNGEVEYSQTDISGTTLTNIPTLEDYDCNGKVFVGWTTNSSYEDPTDAPNDLITNTTGMTIPENGEDYYAVFAEESKEEGTPIVSYEYKLVESALVDWSGDYLIAYNSTIFADGRIGGKDDGGIGALNVYCNPEVDLSNDGKTVTSTFGDVYHVTLEKYDDKYLLKTQDGYYNYQTTNSNGLSKTATKNTAAAYALNIIFTSSSDIKLALSGNAQGAIFRYNGQGYFRFYKDGGQNPIYLYKKTQTTTSGGTTTTYSDYTTQCSKQPSRYLTPKHRGDSGGT